MVKFSTCTLLSLNFDDVLNKKRFHFVVTKTLPTILPGVSADDAQRAYQESKEVGAGLVLVAVKVKPQKSHLILLLTYEYGFPNLYFRFAQEHAEFYAMTMMKYALRATIEPDGYTL